MPRAHANMGALRGAARGRVAARVRAARLAFVTDLPGQESVYADKEREARRFLAAPAAPAALEGFPWIAAELAAFRAAGRPLDAHGVAQLWLNLGALWRAVGPAMERVRIGTGLAIDAAPTPDALARAEARFARAMDAFTPPEEPPA